jgi:hypothetical protein
MSEKSIEHRLAEIEKLQEEQKNQKGMLVDLLESDPELSELEEKVKDAKTRFTSAREAAMNEPAAKKISERMKEIAVELKETKQLLADDLVAYVVRTQSTEYTTQDGTKRQIRMAASLRPQKES